MAKADIRNINFNSKHLEKGDPLPPYHGKPRLFNMRFCPYAHRAVLVLNAKKIDYELINVNLHNRPEWLSKKSTLGKVPALEIQEDVCILESLVIAEYLDEVYPQRPLLPKDPVKKAFDKIITEVAGAIITLLYRTITVPDSIAESEVTAYNKALEFIQEHLKNRGTKFLDGNEPGYVDYMLWPWFERIIPFSSVEERLKIDPVKYKLLLDEYVKNMLEDPIVKEYMIPGDKLIEFMTSYGSGEPKYTLLN